MREKRVNKIWVGLSDMEMDGEFVWADGESLDLGEWSNWKSGPNSYRKPGCVHMMDKAGAWKDMKCTKPMPFVCQATVDELRN